jgi:hypothetical protein
MEHGGLILGWRGMHLPWNGGARTPEGRFNWEGSRGGSKGRNRAGMDFHEADGYFLGKCTWVHMLWVMEVNQDMVLLIKSHLEENVSFPGEKVIKVPSPHGESSPRSNIFEKNKI